ncbi:MAG: Trp repressor-binding protein [Zetaproteobacteria bacterium]|nr:MAG: Trp repressor-binding protein [Zetaproteobacteria bacterium]
MNALVVYDTRYGNTARVAEAITAGVSAGGVRADCAKAQEVSADDWPRYALVVVGTPVQMGGPSPAVRALLASTSKLWMDGAMQGRLGAAFATFGGLGGAGGGVELTLISIWATFAELGMLCAPCPKVLEGFADAGLHWGLAVRSADAQGMPLAELPPAALKAARAFGAYLAELIVRAPRQTR